MFLLLEHIPKLLFASLVGFLIGLERLKKGKPAGVSTYSIICMTSCLLTILSVYGFDKNTDPSRLLSNIITGIGFVSAGVIFTTSQNDSVKIVGLTTGATVFCISSLGIGIGLGYYSLIFIALLLLELNILISIKLKKYLKKRQIIDNQNDEYDCDSLI